MAKQKQQDQSITTIANPRLYTYVVARDYGFAPNPFYGVCTLATCKPDIRRSASPGDYIVGVGQSPNNHRLVYWMKVYSYTTYDEYWASDQYQCKKPSFDGSLKKAYGDNIYRTNGDGDWIQAPSHHSFPNGTPNPLNIKSDTKTNKVLLGTEFAYWGSSGPSLPRGLRHMCGGRGHRCRFPEDERQRFIDWLKTNTDQGCQGLPQKWR
ncbi:MAG: hypothetical protein F6K11_25430 [Leptolyngbya sp. SIO3F4]|nr:hypothetical protein [Leptolyngbya sp. SIO3F4]